MNEIKLKNCECGGLPKLVKEPNGFLFVYYCVCQKCNKHTGGSKKIETAKKNWQKES